MNDLPNGQAIHLTFDQDQASYLVILHKVKTYHPSELTEEMLEELGKQVEIPDDLPEDVGVIANEMSTANFDSLEDVRGWLNDNLERLWGWMTGFEQALPSDLSMPNR